MRATDALFSHILAMPPPGRQVPRRPKWLATHQLADGLLRG